MSSIYDYCREECAEKRHLFPHASSGFADDVLIDIPFYVLESVEKDYENLRVGQMQNSDGRFYYTAVFKESKSLLQ